MSTINLRYALSAFYISAAFWCRLFSVRALYYVKITQAGVLVILSYTVIHRIGTVLLDRHHGRELQTGEKLADAGYAVVFLAVILHGMFDSIFSGSDFLLERAMEAKAYCANLVLPSVFLVCLRLWYEPDCLDLRKILLVITIAAVPISMSSLATVPAAVTAFFIPVLLRTRRGKDLLWYFCFILPEAVYMLLYFLYKLDILVIGV